ncbi:MAG: helix-turn-helix domain-containing protein [Pseudomonas veronii]|uniref:helix-turn-helix domain-containing protein n=1 Tax=Pseudomonas veronii TaxID=76761 RepID=UPI003C7604A7
MRREIKHHERIKMRLRLVGSSLAQVARELGVQPSTVAAVSRGKTRSRRIEAAIGAKLGIPPERLWPERTAAGSIPPSTLMAGRVAMP